MAPILRTPPPVTTTAEPVTQESVISVAPPESSIAETFVTAGDPATSVTFVSTVAQTSLGVHPSLTQTSAPIVVSTEIPTSLHRRRAEEHSIYLQSQLELEEANRARMYGSLSRSSHSDDEESSGEVVLNPGASVAITNPGTIPRSYAAAGPVMSLYQPRPPPPQLNTSLNWDYGLYSSSYSPYDRPRPGHFGLRHEDYYTPRPISHSGYYRPPPPRAREEFEMWRNTQPAPRPPPRSGPPATQPRGNPPPPVVNPPVSQPQVSLEEVTAAATAAATQAIANAQHSFDQVANRVQTSVEDLTTQMEDLRAGVSESMAVINLRMELEQLQRERAEERMRMEFEIQTLTRENVTLKTQTPKDDDDDDDKVVFKTDSFPKLQMETKDQAKSIMHFIRWQRKVRDTIKANKKFRKVLNKDPERIWAAISMCQTDGVNRYFDLITDKDTIGDLETFFERVKQKVLGVNSKNVAVNLVHNRRRAKNEVHVDFVEWMKQIYTEGWRDPDASPANFSEFMDLTIARMDDVHFTTKWVDDEWDKKTKTVNQFTDNMQEVLAKMQRVSWYTPGHPRTTGSRPATTPRNGTEPMDVNMTQSPPPPTPTLCPACKKGNHPVEECRTLQQWRTKAEKEKEDAKKSKGNTKPQQNSHSSFSSPKPQGSAPKDDKSKSNAGKHVGHVEDQSWGNPSGNAKGRDA